MERRGSLPGNSRSGTDACAWKIARRRCGLACVERVQSGAKAARIVDCGARLREDLSATRENFSIGVHFLEVVSRVRITLQEIGDSSESGAAGGDAEALAEFAANYTMQSERDVYESATKAPADAAAAAVAPPESAPKDAEEAGEDVEFF